MKINRYNKILINKYQVPKKVFSWVVWWVVSFNELYYEREHCRCR